jgi:hypothetical protein
MVRGRSVTRHAAGARFTWLPRRSLSATAPHPEGTPYIKWIARNSTPPPASPPNPVPTPDRRKPMDYHPRTNDSPASSNDSA